MDKDIGKLNVRLKRSRKKSERTAYKQKDREQYSKDEDHAKRHDFFIQ